ncbi:MAG: hypothetical protein WCK31_02535 [bacterium]
MNIFPKEYIELQFIFANKVVEILGISFLSALFDYTSMPVRVGVPFSDMKPSNVNWIKFINTISTNKDIDIAYEYYVLVEKDNKEIREQHGFCSYDFFKSEYLVNLHFKNNENPEPGLLSDERMPIRLKELKEMFSLIKIEYPDAKEVMSSSWLFNIPKFNKLFPLEFFDNTSIKWDFHSLGIWGQFIDKYGNIKEKWYNEFVEKINKAKSLDDLKEAFSLKCIKCWSEIKFFYDLYGIKNGK